MGDNELNDRENFRRFLIKKYVVELIFYLVVVSTLFVFKHFDFIDSTTTGTLVASVIGYFVSDIRKIHS